MRKTLFAIAVVVCTMVSCSKEPRNKATLDDFQGSWVPTALTYYKGDVVVANMNEPLLAMNSWLYASHISGNTYTEQGVTCSCEMVGGHLKVSNQYLSYQIDLVDRYSFLSLYSSDMDFTDIAGVGSFEADRYIMRSRKLTPAADLISSGKTYYVKEAQYYLNGKLSATLSPEQMSSLGLESVTINKEGVFGIRTYTLSLEHKNDIFNFGSDGMMYGLDEDKTLRYVKTCGLTSMDDMGFPGKQYNCVYIIFSCE